MHSVFYMQWNYGIRSSHSELKTGRLFVPLCYGPDVEALLRIPHAVKTPGVTAQFHHNI
jgi:hypothetical protein